MNNIIIYEMEYIDKIIFINLDRRRDRLEEIIEEFKRMNIPPNKILRFDAISHPLGNIGCSLSHLQVMKMVKENNWKNVLILEDDFNFIVEKEFLNEFLNYVFNTLNKPWDVIMFGYNFNEPNNYSLPFNNDPYLGKVGFAQTASGYLINQHYYDTLLSNYEEGNRLLMEKNKHWLYANDLYWRVLQEKDEWLYSLQRIGLQRKSYSDNARGITDYQT